MNLEQLVKENRIINFKADDGRYFLYYDKFRVLIPLNQKLELKLCENYYNNKSSVSIGNFSVTDNLIKANEAYELFGKLRQLKAMDLWKIDDHFWFVDDGLFIPQTVYNGRTRYTERIAKNSGILAYDLRVIYLGGDSCLRDKMKLSIYGLKMAQVQPVLKSEQPNQETVDLIKNDKKSDTKQDSSSVQKNSSATSEKKSDAKQDSSVASEIESLLNCDTKRCGLPAYRTEMLYDVKAGHWDVFENPELYKDLNPSVVPRDPKKDIRKNGIIGIDFGTKSTVVVKQENRNEIRPLRIGSLSLGVEVNEQEYENPTFIACNRNGNLDGFLSKYLEKTGRPETSCEDFIVSYDAYSIYNDYPPEYFYSAYSDLKQWANSEKEDALIQDYKTKDTFYLNEECSGEEKRINPIELYAYYIGMYINNMRNGIYMKYIMSFPVKYSRATRELIRNSFEKGLKKSLPQSIIDNAELMKDFSVKYQLSEPAAYAVTAMERAGLMPENENEKYLYGIFDFGGGTTDFDFGIWRGASDDEYDKYNCDYVLECFGADSDVNLGGEKILEMLAYEVFKDNRKMAAENKIACALPAGQIPFIGGETLINHSRSAYRNLTLLKEAFRPLWEQRENWEEKYQDKENSDEKTQFINIQLYNFDGKPVPNCKFEINTDHLLELIKTRIGQGVDAFFKCIEKIILQNAEAQCSSEEIYIFLAGNSCKSIFVKELFDEAVNKYNAEYSEIANKKQNFFKIFAPLVSDDSDSQYSPNCKTGVAYGLVKSRPGGKIRVIKNNQTDSETEAMFRYYLGTDRRGRFVCKLTPVMEDKTWHQFQGAGTGVARIYYTENPAADSKDKKLDINEVPFHEISFEPDENKYLFIRIAGPAKIEYTTACSENEIGDDISELNIEP